MAKSKVIPKSPNIEFKRKLDKLLTNDIELGSKRSIERIVEDYHQLLSLVEGGIGADGRSRRQIAEAIRMNYQAMWRRKESPELWGKDELLKIWKTLNIS